MHERGFVLFSTGDSEPADVCILPSLSMATHTTLSMRQLQVPRYNHPCGDLIDGGRRKEYLDIVVPLYRASIEGDWVAAKDILQGREYLVRYSITESKETPLHVAAAAGHNTKFVRYLVNMMTGADLELQDEDGNTAFCLATISGNVEMARIMIVKNKALPTICGSDKKMPLYLAAFHGNHKMVTFLYNLSDKMRDWAIDDMNRVLLKCIQADLFDSALRILENKEELPRDMDAWNVLTILARKRAYTFQEHKRPYISRVIESHLTFTGLTKHTLNKSDATLLLRLIWKRIMKRPKNVIDKILRGPMIEKDGVETYPSQVLFIAAKMGNIKFLAELIREYPDLIRRRNDDGQSIFHISVTHRHREIYGLLYEIGSIKDQITPITDQQGNNILHLVGMNREENTYGDYMLSTPFQYFEELSWYEEVENILPPPYRDVENKEGLTPKQLFLRNHSKLGSKCVEWIHETINQSMVVSVLVCTIGFSAVYQIPGGFDGKTGSPILLQKNFFLSYIGFNVLSFIFSAYSILMFLSIIISCNKLKAELLIVRWTGGQLSLMMSIATLAFAFVISSFALYGGAYGGFIPYCALGFACVLFTIGLIPSGELYKEAIYATYLKGTNLFRPKKPMIYRA